MIKSKLFLYDSTYESNGYKGEELSQYLLQADTYTEDITNQVDTCELTLVNYPFKKEFEPQTKFILEKYEYFNINGQEEIEETPTLTYHLVVGKDIVTQPILSDNTKFDHKLFLYEPSIIAQQRLVDNSSVTYKLKDVSLETAPSFDLQEQQVTEFKEFSFTSNVYTGVKRESGFFKSGIERSFAKKFVLEGKLELIENNIAINEKNIQVDTTKIVKLKLPKIAIYCGKVGKTNEFVKVGYSSIAYEVIRYDNLNLTNGKVIKKGSVLSNDNFTLYNQELFNYPGDIGRGSNFNGLPDIDYSANYKDCLVEQLKYVNKNADIPYIYMRKYSAYPNGNPNLSLNNELANIYSQAFSLLPNYIYQFKVYIYESKNAKIRAVSLGTDINIKSNNIYSYTQEINRETFIKNYRNTYSEPYQESNMTALSQIQTFSLDTLDVVYESATPYSCYDAIAKAIIGTETYNKVNNVFVGDINATDNEGNYIQPYPFYIDQNYEDMLRQTRINETFFSQKNLWEVLTEIGYYIHAVPEIKFGKNEKFMITFNKLGEPNITEQNGTTQKLNILNYKGVEDYISAVSSYVENIVQLGGEILEVVAPKTTDERFLVYNDTADIVVSKGIIELLDIKVKCITDRYQSMSTLNGITLGSVANLTDFIFEKNVYDTLPLNPNNVPNKGLAMYYELGDNAIKGGDFRTPTVNVGEQGVNDYAIKKIIYSAYYQYSTAISVWDNIYINDFVFIVRYRTKDSIRQHQTRPDLRKYLLNTKWDKVPTHYQFNNQTETLVDSERLGQNIYGKLIRTGNTNYKIAEWNNSLDNIKHKGELYDINGERYYVAKATHTFNADHIESDIEYSKDYNQLSQVIGIPSEPRFYEISEQSQIKREVVINDYLIVGEYRNDYTTNKINYYFKDLKHINQLIFGDGAYGQEPTGFAKFVVSVFKNDIDMSGLNSTDGTKYFYADFLSPLSSYSSGNTLTYSWDMKDNYSAGDKVLYDYSTSVATDNNAYRPMQAVRYTDKFGKANLLDFYILSNSELVNELTSNEIASLPESPYCTINFEEYLTITNNTESTSPSQDEIKAQIQDDIVVGGLYYVKFKNNKNNEYYFIYTYQNGEFLQQGQYKNLTIITFKERLTINSANENVYPTQQEILSNIQVSPNNNDYYYIEYTNSLGNKYYYVYMYKNGTFEIDSQYNNDSIKKGVKTLQNENVVASNKTFVENVFDNGLALMKDNRESISINYNLNLLSDSDTFVISPFVFEQNKENVRLVFLSEEINKLSNGYINNASILPLDLTSEETKTEFAITSTFNPIQKTLNIAIDVEDITEESFSNVKAYAIIYGDGSYSTKFILGRNRANGWDKEKFGKSLTIQAPYNEQINQNKQ